MKQRLITAGVLLCILVPVLIFSGTILFPIVASLFCAIGVFEMLRCLGVWQKRALSLPSIVLAAALPLGTACINMEASIGEGLTLLPVSVTARCQYLLLCAACFTLYMFYLFALTVFSHRTITFAETAGVYVAVFYITLAFTALPMIRLGEQGEYYYLLCFLGAWITDSFAYFTGVFFGRHKLIPDVSPKKTVEGSLGGMVFCVLSFAFFGYFVGRATGLTPNYLVLCLLGLCVSVLSQIGDLFASVIKREHGIKDYGNIFPGHGGVLDRFDSVIATTPLLLIVCTVDALLPVQLLL